MERSVLESILTMLKTSNDKAVIHKALVKLRTDLVKDRNGIVQFREAGGVPVMVRFLQKPYEPILEVSLSILGNCCTQEECCKQAMACQVGGHLVTIQKSIPNPVIQGRVLRLLGNLAKVNANAMVEAFGAGLASSLHDIIKGASNVHMRIGAIRCCRFLIVNRQFAEHFARANGIPMLLNILASILRNEEAESLPANEQPEPKGLKVRLQREKYFEEVARNLEGVRSDIFDHEMLKNYERPWNKYILPKEREASELTDEIVKTFLILSERYAGSYMQLVWRSIGESNTSLAPLVFLVTSKNSFRSNVLKILSNFAKHSNSFAVLSAADAAVASCELLTASTHELSHAELRHCINVIVLLSTDACNRSKIRRTGALCKLLALLRDSPSQTERALIWFLMNNFQYDNMSMELMFREGLVQLLVRELNLYLTSDDEMIKSNRLEKQQSSKKRKLAALAECSLNKHQKKKEEVVSESPSSTPPSNLSHSSPCSSRSISPMECPLSNYEGEDDETYSPIYSEDEEEGEGTPSAEAQPSDYSEIMKLLEIANESIEDNALDKEEEDTALAMPEANSIKIPHIGNLPRSTLDILENLIFRTTSVVAKHPDLGRADTLDTLVRAIKIFGPNNNFANALTNILLEGQFFRQVIKLGIAHQLFMLFDKDVSVDNYSFLETLTCVGESNYGREELARYLRSSDKVFQNRAAITVAYIVRSARLLHQFMNDGDALTVLFNAILRKQQDDYAYEAINALTSMSRTTLGITIPRPAYHCRGYIEQETLCPEIDCDMRFLVYEPKQPTDQSGPPTKQPVIVHFNQRILCENSEVFHRMLNSDFVEGRKQEITLRSYSASGLKYFLNQVMRYAGELSLNIPPRQLRFAMLEAFEMSRFYIMPTLEQQLLQLLITTIDETNCLTVFEWSLKNYHNELCDTAINYYLSAELDAETKIQLYRNAEDSSCAGDWLRMIIEAVLIRCRSGI